MNESVENPMLVGIHLGCGRTSIHGWKFFYKKRGVHGKLWPVERYVQLAQLIRNQFPSAKIFITGTANEKFLGRRFSSFIPGTINLIGKTSALELFQLIEKSDCFITHDCGVLHIASASSTPLIGLFGPTNVRLTGPYPMSDRHRIIKKPAMTEIDAGEVVQALLEVVPQSTAA